MSKPSTVIVALAFWLIAVPVVHAENDADTESWIGKWTNTDANTNSTTRLVITNDEGKLAIQGFGKCSPKDCDWGTTDLHICSVRSPAAGVVGFASWDAKFKDRHIVLRLKKGQLVVESFEIYKDDSGRTNHSATETFSKR